jgi:hypothetical protein
LSREKKQKGEWGRIKSPREKGRIINMEAL